jgi:hypothetical protein
MIQTQNIGATLGEDNLTLATVDRVLVCTSLDGFSIYYIVKASPRWAPIILVFGRNIVILISSPNVK